MSDGSPHVPLGDHIPDQDKRWLKENWLPLIDQILDRRKPIKYLMIGVLVVMVAVCLVAAVPPLMGWVEFHWSPRGTSLVIALLIFAVVFAYLGKLQACDDQIPIIHLAVGMGDRKLLFEAVARLGGYGELAGIIKHVQSAVGTIG